MDMLIERELVTPELDGSILPGVTRDSILSLTRSWGEFKVSERKFTMKDLVKADKEGRIIEMFGMLHYLVYLLIHFELSCAVHAEKITHFCHENTSREYVGCAQSSYRLNFRNLSLAHMGRVLVCCVFTTVMHIPWALPAVDGVSLLTLIMDQESILLSSTSDNLHITDPTSPAIFPIAQ